LVLTAVNLALEKARLLQQQQLGPLVGGLPV
jgi:hypothetical protein